MSYTMDGFRQDVKNAMGRSCMTTEEFNALFDQKVATLKNQLTKEFSSKLNEPITIATELGLSYSTYVGKNSSGVVKTWAPADLVQS